MSTHANGQPASQYTDDDCRNFIDCWCPIPVRAYIDRLAAGNVAANSDGADLFQRIEHAIARVAQGDHARRVPAENTDPDIVLADCRDQLIAQQRQIASARSEAQGEIARQAGWLLDCTAPTVHPDSMSHEQAGSLWVWAQDALTLLKRIAEPADSAPGEVEWRPMTEAPKDGRRVLLQLGHGLPAHVANFEGVVFVGKWLGGHSLWAFAAPVGHAGFPDDWMIGWRPLAARAPSAQGEGFGVSDESLKLLLSRCLKPEEIAADAATQHDRVHELVAWFARFANGDANAKWANAHAFELAYYLATTGGNRHIDLRDVREKSFKEGLNVSPSDRAMLERLGVARPSAPAAGHGVALIAAERQRQVATESWTPEHDDEHALNELAAAAACYAAPETLGYVDDEPARPRTAILAHWPWRLQWWKPTPQNRTRELVKAGALIAAEIDRLQRAAGAAPRAPKPQEPQP